MKYTETGTPEGINRGKMRWGNSHPSQNSRFWSNDKVIGMTDCGCNAGFHPGICLDPFIGSGTVGVAARILGRDFVGIELNANYVKIAEKRIASVPDRLI